MEIKEMDVSAGTLTTQKGSWKITPKGWLAVRTDLFGGIDQVWDDLVQYVSKQADLNGMTKGDPCLVLRDGGYCIRVVGRPVDSDEVISVHSA